MKRAIWHNNSLYIKFAKKTFRSQITCSKFDGDTGVSFGVGTVLQVLALESNNPSLRSVSNALLGIGGVLLIYTFDINKSSNSKMKKEIKASKQKLEELKQEPIIVR